MGSSASVLQSGRKEIRAAIHSRGAYLVGIAGRFPNADNVEELWEQLKISGEAGGIEQGPARWPVTCLPFVPAAVGRIKHENVFDAEFWCFSDIRTCTGNPVLWHLLEVIYEAVLDSGLSLSKLQSVSNSTGVYIALSTDLDCIITSNQSESFLAARSSDIPSRISHVLGTCGPAIGIDAESSSSLIAVDIAMRDLQRGIVQFAIVAGGNLVVNPWVAQGLQYVSSGSEEQRSVQCSQADGVTAIILAREMATCCRIYSVLLGSGSNFDGSKQDDASHFDSQSLLMLVKETCRNSGIRCEDIVYIESSGPGIQAVDGEEMKAFVKALVPGRPEAEKVITCAASTNGIGHCRSVSGLVSVIVSVLAMHHGSVPHAFTYNMDQRGSESQVQTPWQCSDGIALVTSRGLGGTNDCLLLAPFRCEKPQNTLSAPVLLPIHARCDRGFDLIDKAVEHSCRSCPEKLFLMEKSLLVSDTLQPMRGYIIVSPELEILAREKLPPCKVSPSSLTLVLFWGDFSSVPVTADPELWQIPAFAESLDASDKIFEDLSGGAYYSIAECIAMSDRKLDRETRDSKNMSRAHIIFGTAIQIGLAETIRQACGGWAAVAGGGLGVLAAAYYDGCLTQRQCLKVAHTLSIAAESWADDLMTNCTYQVALVHLKSDEVYQLGPNIRILAILTDFLVIIGIPKHIPHLVDSVQKQTVMKGGQFQEIVTSPFFNPLLKPDIRDIALQKLKAIIPHPQQWSDLAFSVLCQYSPKSVKDLLCDAEYIISSLLCPLDQPALIKQLLQQPDFVIVAHVPGCEGGMLAADGRNFTQTDSSRILGWSPSVLDVLSVLGKIHTLGCKINLSAIHHQLDRPLDCSVPPLSPLATWDHTTCWPFPHWMEFTCKEKDELISMYSFSLDESGDDSSRVADLLYHTWFAVATRLQNMDMSKPTGVRLFNMVEEQNLALVDCSMSFFLQVQLGRKAFNIFNEDGVVLSGCFEELRESSSQPIMNFLFAYWDKNRDPAVEDHQAIWMFDWEDDWQLYLRQIFRELENVTWRMKECPQQMDGRQRLVGGLPEEAVFLPQFHAEWLELHQNSVTASFHNHTGLFRAGGVILHFHPLLTHGFKKKKDGYFEISTHEDLLFEENHRHCTFDEKTGMLHVTVTKDPTLQHALETDTSSGCLSSELRSSHLQIAHGIHKRVPVKFQKNRLQSSPERSSASVCLPLNPEEWNKAEKRIRSSTCSNKKHPSWRGISCRPLNTGTDKRRMLADDRKSDVSCRTSVPECLAMLASLSPGSNLSPSSNKENTSSTTSLPPWLDQLVNWPLDSSSGSHQENEMNLMLDESFKRQFPFADTSSTLREQGNMFGQERLEDQLQILIQNKSCMELSTETKLLGMDGVLTRTDRTVVKHLEVVLVCEDIEVILFYGIIDNNQQKVAGFWSEEYPDEVLQVCVPSWWETRHQHFFLLWVTAMYIMDRVDLNTTKTVLVYPPLDSLSITFMLAASHLAAQVFVLAPDVAVPDVVHKICPRVGMIPEVFWGQHLQQSGCTSGCSCVKWHIGDITYAMDQLPASGRLIQCGQPLNSVQLSMTFFNKNTTLVCLNPQQAIRDLLAQLSQLKDTAFLRLPFPSLLDETSCELILSLKMSDCLGSSFESQHSEYLKQPTFLPVVLKAQQSKALLQTSTGISARHNLDLQTSASYNLGLNIAADLVPKNNQEATDEYQNKLLQPACSPSANAQDCYAGSPSENITSTISNVASDQNKVGNEDYIEWRIPSDPSLYDAGRDGGYRWQCSFDGFPASVCNLSEHNLWEGTPGWYQDFQVEPSVQTPNTANSDWPIGPDEIIDQVFPMPESNSNYYLAYSPTGVEGAAQVTNESPEMSYDARGSCHSQTSFPCFGTEGKSIIEEKPIVYLSGSSTYAERCLSDSEIQQARYFTFPKDEIPSEKDDLQDTFSTGEVSHVKDNILEHERQVNYEGKGLTCDDQINIASTVGDVNLYMPYLSTLFKHDSCAVQLQVNVHSVQQSFSITGNPLSCDYACSDSEHPGHCYGKASAWIPERETVCNENTDIQISSTTYSPVSSTVLQTIDDIETLRCVSSPEMQTSQSNDSLTEPPCDQDEQSSVTSCSWCSPASENLGKQSRVLLEDAIEEAGFTKILLPAALMDFSDLEPVAATSTTMEGLEQLYAKTVPSSADKVDFDGCLPAAAAESCSLVPGVGLDAAGDQRGSAKQRALSVSVCEENMVVEFPQDGSIPACEFPSAAIFSALALGAVSQPAHQGSSHPSERSQSGTTGDRSKEKSSFSSIASNWREQLRHEECEGSFSRDQSVSAGDWFFDSPDRDSPRIPLFSFDPFMITKSASSSVIDQRPQLSPTAIGCLGEKVLTRICQHSNNSPDSEARRMMADCVVNQVGEDVFHQGDSTKKKTCAVGFDMHLLENQDTEDAEIVSLTRQPLQYRVSDSSTPKQGQLKTCASPQNSLSDDPNSQIVWAQRNLPNPILPELLHSEDALMSPPSNVQFSAGFSDPQGKSWVENPEQFKSDADDNLDLDFAFQFDSHNMENENNVVLEIPRNIPFPLRNAQAQDAEEQDDSSQSGDSGIEFQLTEEISSSNQHRFAFNLVSGSQRGTHMLCRLPGETSEGTGDDYPPCHMTSVSDETGCIPSQEAAVDVGGDQMQSLDAGAGCSSQQESQDADHIYSIGLLPACPENSSVEIPHFSWSPLMLFTNSNDHLHHTYDSASGGAQVFGSEQCVFESDKPKTSLANDSEMSHECFHCQALISSTPSRSEIQVQEQPEETRILKVDSTQELQKFRDFHFTLVSDHSQESTSSPVSSPDTEGQSTVKVQHEDIYTLADDTPDQHALGFENHKPAISSECHSAEQRMTREDASGVLPDDTILIPAGRDASKKLEISQQNGAFLALAGPRRPKILCTLSTSSVLPAELQPLNKPSGACLFKQPLYLVHPITGSVEIFRTLASWLDIHCIGVKRTPETPATSVEDIARHYCNVIKHDNWFGPYQLAGYSYGGLLVFEMARQFQQEGKKVELLLMLDGSPHYIKGQVEHVQQQIPDVSEDEIPGIMESQFLLRFMDMYIPVPQRALVQEKLEKSPSRKERISLAVSLTVRTADSSPTSERTMTTSGNIRVGSHDHTSSQEVAESTGLQRQQKAADFITAAFLASKYHPPETAELRFVGDVYLIRIKKCPPQCTPLPADYGLSSLCSGNVNIFYVDGDHESIFHDPHVCSMASIVQTILSGKARRQGKIC